MNISFRAMKIASTQNSYHNKTTKIDLYRLSQRDIPSLEEWGNSVKYSELMPKMCEYSQNRWQKVFNYGIESAKDPSCNAFVAISEDKPCGLLTFIEEGKILYLDCICDIPIQKNKKVNYTGSTLFCEIFKFADRIKAKGIELLAVTDGPIDVISKYKAKGFKEVGTDGAYIKMRCNKFKIKEQLNELLSKINYKSIKNSPEVDLRKLII